MSERSVQAAIHFLATLFLVLVLVGPFPGLAQEEEKEAPASEEAEPVLSGGLEIDANSRYLWHGIALSEGPVLEPSAWISAYDFTFTSWGNYVLTDEPNQGQFNEVDLILGYSREWKNFSLETLYQHYLYPNQEPELVPDTGEISLSLAYSIKSFEFFTTHTVDVVEYSGSYFGELGIGYSYEFNSKLSIEADAYGGAASSKFNEVNLGLSKSAFNLAGGGLGLIYYPIETFYLRPHLEVTALMDSELSDLVEDPTIFNYGLAVGMEF